MKLFSTANEKYVKSVVLYANAQDVLCYDAAATKKVPADEVKNLFEKGLLVVATEAGEYRPTVFTNETTYYAVSAIVMGVSAAEAKTFKSDNIA